jgi:hypothetical protein
VTGAATMLKRETAYYWCSTLLSKLFVTPKEIQQVKVCDATILNSIPKAG